MSLCLILRSLIQLFGPKRVTQLLNYDIIEFPEEGYLLHFKLEFPEGENQLLYSCAYWQTRQRLRAPSSNFTCRRKLYHWEGFETAHTNQEDIWALYLYLYGWRHWREGPFTFHICRWIHERMTLFDLRISTRSLRPSFSGLQVAKIPSRLSATTFIGIVQLRQRSTVKHPHKFMMM